MTTPDIEIRNPAFINNLRFGDGALLRDGTGDNTGGRTLKGRYIVRVGWDDVRGWFAEVCAPFPPFFPLNSFIVAQICVLIGSYENRAARSSVLHAHKRSEHPRVDLSPHIILSKRELTPWQCAEAMVL